jgi:ParB-like nuclease domain
MKGAINMSDDTEHEALQPPLFEGFISPRDNVQKTRLKSSEAPARSMTFQPGRLYKVVCAQVLENQQHARRYFSDDSLLMLADSIRNKGLLQPLVCTLTANGELELAAGYAAGPWRRKCKITEWHGYQFIHYFRCYVISP